MSDHRNYTDFCIYGLKMDISISKFNFVDVNHKSLRPFQALIGQMGLVNFCLVVSSG